MDERAVYIRVAFFMNATFLLCKTTGWIDMPWLAVFSPQFVLLIYVIVSSLLGGDP